MHLARDLTGLSNEWPMIFHGPTAAVLTATPPGLRHREGRGLRFQALSALASVNYPHPYAFVAPDGLGQG